MTRRGSFLATVFVLSATVAHSDPVSDIVEHVNCYPRGLDLIGAGQDAEGVEVWNACYVEDFSFTLDLGWGAPTVCTASACQLPGDTSIARRANFARGVYDQAGFTSTEHSLENTSVELIGSDTAEATSDITAVHFGAGGSVVTGYGQWSVTLSQTSDGWRITDETLTITRSEREN